MNRRGELPGVNPCTLPQLYYECWGMVESLIQNKFARFYQTFVVCCDENVVTPPSSQPPRNPPPDQSLHYFQLDAAIEKRHERSAERM